MSSNRQQKKPMQLDWIELRPAKGKLQRSQF